MFLLDEAKFPLMVECVKCRACSGAPCTEPETVSWRGTKVLTYFHPERIRFAIYVKDKVNGTSETN